MAKIVIDPGHGGVDPGAIGKKSKEKDNVLKVAIALRTLLEGYGHEVILTRENDRYLSLTQRANIANNKGADYFLSLHNNSASNANATGFETFIFSGKVSEKTKRFQKVVHNAISANIGIRDRGMKSANFAVLRQTKMVALLIEYAFISNIHDEKLLVEKPKELAEMTCEGIVEAIGGSLKAKAPKSNSKPKETPKKNTKTITQMAEEIIAGKHGNGNETRRKSLGISKSEYEKVRAEVNRLAGQPKSKPKKSQKSISQMVQEVIDGKHGNGHEARRKSLGVTQTEYNKVRTEVNKRLSGKGNGKSSSKSISQMAEEVIAGKHGNGHAERRKSLGITQTEYNKVRAEVNKRLK